MSNPDESITEATSGELIKGGVELIKVAYGDGLQPVTKEVGKALGTLGKTINLALSPIRGVVWGWEKIEVYLTETVERKLDARKVPSTRIITPDPDIAVPAIEALRYSKLRENYANLLATAMDSETAMEVHPAFVEVLKQLSMDEARILEFLPNVGRYEPLMDFGYTLPKGEFLTHRHVGALGIDAKCSNLNAMPQLIQNLCRLGLTEIPPLRRLTEDSRYERIRNLDVFTEAKTSIPDNGQFLEVLSMIGLTPFGASFKKACVQNSD